MSDAPLLPMKPRPSGWQRTSQVALVASLAGGSLLALLAWRQGTTTSEVAAKRDVDASFYPRPGHKLQVQPNAFTVNDWECMVLDTKLWPSERVHCELAPDETYRWVVEHFDDPNCTRLNKANPYAVHGTGCFLFKQYNQSYKDTCHLNRTATVSAFKGPGCIEPLPITATNLRPM